ncbi:MAG: hypothetical protein IPH08_04095 [Rhodocyclaceae bacterium]|nr:hypothetical protein [Rhodocyclaceae bacterium]
MTIKLVNDYDSTLKDGDWLGEWYGWERGETGRPDGGYYKVTRSTGRHQDNSQYVIWLKPAADCPRPKDCVDIARAYFRDEWQYVGIVVEQTTVITGDDGKEYELESGAALFGMEYGSARRSWPAIDEGQVIFSQASTNEYLREVARDLRGECEYQSGVPMDDDEFIGVLEAALANGPVWER